MYLIYAQKGKCNEIMVSKKKKKKDLTLYVSHGRSWLKIMVYDLGWLHQGQPFHQGSPDSQNCLIEDANRRCLVDEEVLKEFSFFSVILSDVLELFWLWKFQSLLWSWPWSKPWDPLSCEKLLVQFLCCDLSHWNNLVQYCYGYVPDPTIFTCLTTCVCGLTWWV